MCAKMARLQQELEKRAAAHFLIENRQEKKINSAHVTENTIHTDFLSPDPVTALRPSPRQLTRTS